MFVVYVLDYFMIIYIFYVVCCAVASFYAVQQYFLSWILECTIAVIYVDCTILIPVNVAVLYYNNISCFIKCIPFVQEKQTTYLDRAKQKQIIGRYSPIMFPPTGSISDSLSIMPHINSRRPSMRHTSISATIKQAG